jgi:sigma-B regulation protein RsbU (phosphoserine phosphatase)
MATVQLTVSDSQGSHTVPIDKPVFTIGRRATADLQVIGRDVSRDHAKILQRGDGYVLVDCGSRFGTFVNGEELTGEHLLVHGDKLSLGESGSTTLVFLSEDEQTPGLLTSSTSLPDLPQLAAVLNGLRALGTGRVLDEVLTLVLDAALTVTSAERGFVMLATDAGHLDLKIGRDNQHRTLTGTFSETSAKIPREVFDTGRSCFVSDLEEPSVAPGHRETLSAGIRYVLCVPLRVVPFTASGADSVEDRRIGVLYLDGRERTEMLSGAMRTVIEAFALQAALAIDSARLYLEAAQKAKLDRDLHVAAEIQRSLLPESHLRGASFDVAATTIPCRTVGGDFFDYIELSGGEVGFVVGDVAGKGVAAALLAAGVQTNVVAHASVAADPADLMARVNRALLRRIIESRFATMCYGALSATGRLRYSNAGQEPPIVVRAGGAIEALDVGGPVLGLLTRAAYDCGETTLVPGDLVVMFSDGVTEATDTGGEQYGRERLQRALAGAHGRDPERVLDELLASINVFAGTAPQADDITVLILRYLGACP